MIPSPEYFLTLAGILAIMVALAHSVLGERELIGPMVAGPASARSGGASATVTATATEAAEAAAPDTASVPHAPDRQLPRLMWHWATVLWLFVAAFLVMTAYDMIDSTELLIAIGGIHLAMGLIDAIVTKGRHFGWPIITLVGALTLLAVYQTW